MQIPGVINLSQAAARRVDRFTDATVRLAAAIESLADAKRVANELRDAELNGPRG